MRDFWGVDDDTVVFVADPSLGGNILNFNVGGNIDLRIPRVCASDTCCSHLWVKRTTCMSLLDKLPPCTRMQNFWTRLSSKYGTKFYWQDRGEGATIVNAVSAM